jgi:hypothetical protein
VWHYKAFSKKKEIFVLPKIVEQIEPLGDVDGEGWFGRPFGSNMAQCGSQKRNGYKRKAYTTFMNSWAYFSSLRR